MSFFFFFIASFKARSESGINNDNPITMTTLGGYDDLVRLIRFQRAIFRQNYEHLPHTDSCANFLDHMETLHFKDGDNPILESSNVFSLSCLELIVVCQEAIREGVGGWQSRFKDDIIGDLELKWKEHFLSLPIAFQVDEDKVWQTFKEFYVWGLARFDEEAAQKVLEEERLRARDKSARKKKAAAAEELESNQRLLERLQSRKANTYDHAARKVYKDAANKVAEAIAAEVTRKANNLEAERKQIEAEAKAAQEILEAKIIEGEGKQREAKERAAKEAQKAQNLEEKRKGIEAETRVAQEALEAMYVKKLDEERKQRQAEAKEEATATAATSTTTTTTTAAAAAAATRNNPMDPSKDDEKLAATDPPPFGTPTRRRQHQRKWNTFMI